MLSSYDYHPISLMSTVPNDREIVQAVVDIWRKDKATEKLGAAKLTGLVKLTHSDWQLSEKRVKTVLKAANLGLNQEKFCYAGSIMSHATPGLDMPEKVTLNIAKNRGKGLYAKKDIKKDEELWNEQAFLLVPPLEHVGIMRKGMGCAFCSRPFQSHNGVECPSCAAKWCDNQCKKKDVTHVAMWHESRHGKVTRVEWRAFEDFCVENGWMALYALGLLWLRVIRDPKKDEVQKQMMAFARVGQDERHKAVEQSNSLFASEQSEVLWKKGYEMLDKLLLDTEFSYEKDFLPGLGMFNINNVDGNMYLTQSHLNHSCEPNVDVKNVGRTQGISVRAKRDIKTGEELFTTYVNPEHQLDDRRYNLRVNWGFNCNCTRCKREEREEMEYLDELVSNWTIEHKRKEMKEEKKERTRTRTRSVHFDKEPEVVA